MKYFISTIFSINVILGVFCQLEGVFWIALGGLTDHGTWKDPRNLAEYLPA
jgi:hypothetical protein